jgi:hypothetical protein
MSRAAETTIMPNRTTTVQKKILERRLAIMGLGVLHGLQDETLSLAQAREELFNLDTYIEIKRMGLDKRLVELFEWAMELENVQHLGSKALAISYARMTILINKILVRGPQKSRWVLKSKPAKWPSHISARRLRAKNSA